MKTNDYLVSIVLPAYNAEESVREAVESVIGQTWTLWELIVINDGSTDNTAAVLNEFHDARITVVHQENGGVGAARNAGLALIKGDLVTFLDADDVLPRRSLEVRAEFLSSNHDIDIVDGTIISSELSSDRVVRIYRPYYSGLLLSRLLALDDRVFFGPFYMVRRKVLGDLKFPENMSHAEDLLFFVLMAARQRVLYAFVDEEVYQYRIRPGSAMSDISGLELGYLQFMRATFSSVKVSARQKIFLKLKISKIMFLVRLGKGEYLAALKSVFLCVFTV